MTLKDNSVGVIGAGAFGTALAIVLADAGFKVDLWARSEDVRISVNEARENSIYLKGVAIPDAIQATDDLEKAVHGKCMVLGVTPSHAIRSVFGEAKDFIDRDTLIVCGSKGIEEGSLATVDQMLAETLPDLPRAHIMVLSGPSFAAELARQLPTAVTVAGSDETRARQVQQMLMRPYFRVYTSPDVMGVGMGGAIKNVIAIGAGIAEGLKLGYNARTGLVTRGLRELTRLAVARGALPITMSGLSGLGDLVLTCTGDLSRNRSLGIQLGQNRTLTEIMAGTRTVAEGVKTAKSAMQLAEKYEVEAPICQEVYKVLYDEKDPAVGLNDLMTRPPRSEHEFDPFSGLS